MCAQGERHVETKAEMRCRFCKPVPEEASTTGSRESLGQSPLQELDGDKT